MFNPRTHSFQYDIISKALCNSEETSPAAPAPYLTGLPLFSPSCNLALNASLVISMIPHYLSLLSESGYIILTKSLADFVSHNLLTFGAVFDCKKPGIIRHLPSIPSIEEGCGQAWNSDISLKRSDSGKWGLHKILNL